MADTTGRDLGPLAALAEPIRRRLYDHVVAQPGPVDRDAAAEGAGDRAIARCLPPRPAGRGGPARRRLPAAERPDRPWCGTTGQVLPPTPDREFGVSLPPRGYDLAAEILAEGVERRPEAAEDVLAAARERGERLVADRGDAAGGPDALVRLLAEQGYEPARDEDGAVRLRNCPFHALVDRHRQLTCSMNLAMLEAVAVGVDDTGLVPRAQPRDGYCCVAFVPEAG